METVEQELARKGAPQQVLDAGKRIDQFHQAGRTAPRDLVEVVLSWVGRSNTQDRYGK